MNNRTIISTRPVSEDDSIKEYLIGKGAVIIDMPLIEIVPCPLSENIKNVLSRLQSYDWLIFTSRNGVRCFFSIFDESGVNPETLKNKHIAAIGRKTADEVRGRGFEPGFVSDGATGEDFLKHLAGKIVSPGENVLLALGDLARTTLEEGLKHVASVTRIDVYRTVETRGCPSETLDIINRGAYDIILFTSPSGFNNFMKIMEDNRCQVDLKIGCIGKTTEKEILRHGRKPLLVSTRPDGLTFAREIEKFLDN